VLDDHKNGRRGIKTNKKRAGKLMVSGFLQNSIAAPGHARRGRDHRQETDKNSRRRPDGRWYKQGNAKVKAGDDFLKIIISIVFSQ